MTDYLVGQEEEATTARTLRNIRKTLRYSLEKKYGFIEKERLREIEDKILQVHGLNKNNFDFINKVEDIVTGHLNDNSVDDNSNKNEKTVAGIIVESTAPVSKAIGYDYLYRIMVDLYGKKEAKRLSGEMYDYSIGLSDSSKILVPYCWALDASKMVIDGRPFGQLKSAPPKRVSSYISALDETVHQMSSHLAGAIAIGSFVFDIAYLILYREKKTLEDLRSEEYRKYIENCIQTFVHSVNHLSRNATESPFTNISIFDDVKLRSFVKDMEHYFGKYVNDIEYEEDYIVDVIKEVQNIYLDFFDKGDPMKGGAPYRFPVCTINISKTDEGHIQDTGFVEDIVNREVFRYNIFVSEGSKAASCCRLLSNSEMLEMAGQSNSFGGSGALSLGSHRVATINFNRIALETKGNPELYMEALKERILSAVKVLKAHKDLIVTLADKGLQQFISNGWIDMGRMFSTIGVLGLVESADMVATISKVDKDSFTEDVLIALNKLCTEFGEEYGILVNIEQIPAESMSHRLPKVDKMLFGEGATPYPLYSNQFIPLWEDYSIWERMEKDGRFNQLITGGGIVHFNLGERTTPSQNKKIIDHAVESGCEHFSLNPVYSQCDNGHSNFGKLTVCPNCGSSNITYMTRVVGFFTPVEDWTFEKRTYDFEERNYTQI